MKKSEVSRLWLVDKRIAAHYNEGKINRRGTGMKAKILTALKKAKDQYVSGEELSKTLQVSRTAVWKAVNTLRRQGYEIESSPRLGYRLHEVADVLTPLEISDGLNTKKLGKQIHYFEEVDSTNRVAQELAAEGAREGTIVLALQQTQGKGRLGKAWSSPPGGVWLSLILRPQLVPMQVPLITLLAAVAAVEATIDISGLLPQIKWPNDLLVGEKKLAGILTEVAAEADGIRHAVVGIGININVSPKTLPPELQQAATSLWAETGQAINRSVWVRTFLEKFESYYLEASKHGFAKILQSWRQYAHTLGKEVTVHYAGKTISGRALDIDDHGALLVESEGGIMRCLAGEVTLNKQ